MGSSSSHLQEQSNFHQLFPNCADFKPASQPSSASPRPIYTYRQQLTGKLAHIRSFPVEPAKRNSIEAYFSSRTKLISNPYLLQLFDCKITQNADRLPNAVSNSPSPLCVMRVLRRNEEHDLPSQLWLLTETSTVCLEDEIINRGNKKPFEEIELWSVLSCSVLGAIGLLQSGFKEPVLSPKGIALSQEGFIKVGEWELASKLFCNSATEEGEVLLGRLGNGDMFSEDNKNSLNELLVNYYWAPEGLKYLEQFISMGRKEPQAGSARQIRSARLTSYSSKSSVNCSKFQVFSLGMTLISMCLRNCYYRSETFSEKSLTKLFSQAIQIRKIEGKPLSQQLHQLMRAMIKWDSTERISYIQLRDSIVHFLNQSSECQARQTSYRTVQIQANPRERTAKSRTSSMSSNISSIQISNKSTESYDSNCFAFNNNHRESEPMSNMRRRNIRSVTSSSANEGSGVVEQGNGDDDWNLQSEHEDNVAKQIQQIQVKIQVEKKEHSEVNNSPMTHRTCEQENGVNGSSSPFRQLNLNTLKSMVLTPFPEPVSEDRVSNKSKQRRSGLCEQREDKDGKWKKKMNQVYLQSPDESMIIKSKQDSKIAQTQRIEIQSSDFKLNFSNRSSYPNFSKDRIQPDTNRNQNINYANIAQQPKKELVNICAADIDNDDEVNNGQLYFPDFETEEIQNPDIFESFDQESVLSISKDLVSEKGSQFSAMSDKMPMGNAKLPISTFKETQNTISTSIPQKEEQYMTFNKRTITANDSIQNIKPDDLIPSKWSKDGYSWLKAKSNQSQEQIFTDPKLIEYIKSPVRCPSSSSFSSNLKQQWGEDNDKENLNNYGNCSRKVVSPISMLQLKSSITDANQAWKSDEHAVQVQIFSNQNNYECLNTRIVKEKGARGFYEGEKKNGCRSGYGIFYYNEGGKYRGNWLNNKMHGKGILEYADGRVAYQGEWSNDELHGKGILYNQSPNFISHELNFENLDDMDQCWIFYEGMFQHDDKCGMGLLVLTNQEQFVGQFKQDMADGLGEYLRLDGTIVKGIWEKNKLVQLLSQQ